jgi:hypothetical protein
VGAIDRHCDRKKSTECFAHATGWFAHGAEWFARGGGDRGICAIVFKIHLCEKYFLKEGFGQK